MKNMNCNLLLIWGKLNWYSCIEQKKKKKIEVPDWAEPHTFKTLFSSKDFFLTNFFLDFQGWFQIFFQYIIIFVDLFECQGYFWKFYGCMYIDIITINN